MARSGTQGSTDESSTLDAANKRAQRAANPTPGSASKSGGKGRKPRPRTVRDAPGVRRASVDRGVNKRPQSMGRPERRTPIGWASDLRGMRLKRRPDAMHLVAVGLSWVCVLALFAGAVVLQVGGTTAAVLIAGGTAAASAGGAFAAEKKHRHRQTTSHGFGWKGDPKVRHHNRRMGRDATDLGDPHGPVQVRSHTNAGHGVDGHSRSRPGQGGRGGVNRGQRSGQRNGGRPS